MHYNEIHIYNGNYKKIQSLFEFELQIVCLNPTFFSSNQSPDLFAKFHDFLWPYWTKLILAQMTSRNNGQMRAIIEA